MSETYYQVGKIVNTHGLRGELKVIASTDFPDKRFAPNVTLYIQTKDNYIPVVVTSHRHVKQFDLVQFKGMDDINLVEQYKGCNLKITKANQHALDDGEYYYRDIIGLNVINQATGESLGMVKEIMSPGPNDVWVIDRPKHKELLLPFLKTVVQSIDLETKTAQVIVPEGLIDDED